jgi:thioredoxin 1
MAEGNVFEFTESNFRSEVLESSVPVLVDFWAEWCMPCKRLGPIVAEVADQFEGRAKVGKIDIESNQQLSMELGIQAIPTIIIYKGGKAVDRFTGLRDASDLSAALESALG